MAPSPSAHSSLMSSSFCGISEVAMIPQTAVLSQLVLLLEYPPHILLPEKDWPILTIGGSSIIAPGSLFCVVFLAGTLGWVNFFFIYLNHCRHHYPMAAMCVMIAFYANSSRFRIAMETQIRHAHEDVSRKI